MDLLVSYTLNSQLWVTILWGQHSESGHELLCLEDQNQAWQLRLPLAHEPLVFDYNYDYVSDLFLVSPEGNRTVLVFSRARANYSAVNLTTDRSDPLKAAHSNAHFDMNGDGLPDLMLTTRSGLEIYRRKASNREDNFVFQTHIPWPSEISEAGCPVDACVGQLVLADFDLSGQIDMVLPVCYDTLCKSSSLFLIKVSELWEAKAWNWVPVSLDLGDYHFYPPAPQSNLLQHLAPRAGDVDLDGYADLLVPVQGSSNKPETHLLLNRPCSSCDAPFTRKFEIDPSFMEGMSVAAACFYDIISLVGCEQFLFKCKNNIYCTKYLFLKLIYVYLC